MPGYFKPFDAHREVEKTQRLLPHWQQTPGTYFVTFRLADSLPHQVRLALEERRRLGTSDHDITWADRFLDTGAGSCVLANHENSAMVEGALRYFDRVHYSLGAYAVMPNHVHVLVQPTTGSLTATVHSWKSFTASRLHRQGHRGNIWQTESFDRLVRDEAELRRFHDYILQNPAVAKLQNGFLIGIGSANWFEQS